MTQSKISMIQQAQRLNETEQRAVDILVEMAIDTDIIYEVLCEDVLNVLTNLASNVEAGKGLVAMGGNVNNYAFFLAGLAAIVQKINDPQNPPPQPVKDNVIKILSGLNIAGGLINQNCQKIVDFGARPENQGLAQQYEQVVKNMKANPTPLINVIGKLKIAMGKIATAQPAANTPEALKTKPVTTTPNAVRGVAPTRAGSMPPGGSGV